MLLQPVFSFQVASLSFVEVSITAIAQDHGLRWRELNAVYSADLLNVAINMETVLEKTTL